LILGTQFELGAWFLGADEDDSPTTHTILFWSQLALSSINRQLTQFRLIHL
jgi:hypothetical protein